MPRIELSDEEKAVLWDALRQDAERFNTLLELWHASTELSLTQDEDGRWSITVIEPVDGLPAPGRWTGDDPLEAIRALSASRPAAGRKWHKRLNCCA
jgi:hypothetical protein